MKVYQKSVWKETFTSFNLLSEIIMHEFGEKKLEIMIIGCSDGKYVFPFLENGHKVTAIDSDFIALYGGNVDFQNNSVIVNGLIENLRLENYARSSCVIIHSDFMKFDAFDQYDIVFTSCFWHYKENLKYSIEEILKKIEAITRKNGLFFADYMMPIKEKHILNSHYTNPEVLRDFFHRDWAILLNLDVGTIHESPHIGKDTWHYHHYGAFAAKKLVSKD
jgi:hypothetical protein